MKLEPTLNSLNLVVLILCAAASPAFAQRGRIEPGQITSAALTNNLLGDSALRRYKVYLPPSYDSTQKPYPVIYVLHGYLQDENAMVAVVQPALDSMIRQRSIGEMIAVFVNGQNRLNGSFYLSSPVIGDYETYIAADLVSEIDTNYRTLTRSESRGITGFSMGGWGTMHLALKFPATFSVAVAASGLYDSRGEYSDGLERQLGRLHPTNLVQFGQLPFPVNAIQARLAGLLPNLQRPKLYTDYPYELVDGQLVLIQSAHERCLDRDVQHGDMNRYLQQAVRLKGVKIVHGTSDPLIPVNEARQFTNALNTAGIEFSYEEHPGGHQYLPALALPFLSTHLQGAELYIAPPRLSVTSATNAVQVSFSTQKGVEYRLETCAVLGGTNEVWTEKIRLTGDGQLAGEVFPVETAVQFFRVRAANL